MRKNFGSKAWSYPQPVLMIGSYDENGVPDLMNAAWGMMSDFDQISLCLSASHKTMKNILSQKAFTVSMAVEDCIAACDYAGLVSANKIPDKFEKSGLHAQKSAFVNAPVVKELPMTLECEMISYDSESEILTGKIVNVSAEESILTNGKIDPSKLRPVAFDPVNMKYLALGKAVANAFAAGKELMKEQE